RGGAAIFAQRRTLSMHFRPLVPLGLALATAGCQSTLPYGYNNYPSFAPGTYNAPMNTAPPAGSPPPSLQSGAGPPPAAGSSLGSSTGRTRGQPAKGSGTVPNYNSPGTPPTSLGAPADEEDFDSIKRQGTHNEAPRHLDETEEDHEQALSSVEDDRFLKPT